MRWPLSTPDITLGTYDPFQLLKYRVGIGERSTHTYIIGITGKGKSKLLEHILYQDVIEGRGCGVLDPHGDLADDLLRYLKSDPTRSQPHWERVIYFDPARTDHILPFNVLQSGFDPYETAQNVVEAFRRTWPQALAEAPRFANIATAAILTLIANNLTLVELPRLLSNGEFRAKLLRQVTDPELLSFWRDRYERWGRETPLMIESILNKVTAFTFNPSLRLLLGAQENRLNFRRIMDEGQVLIANLGRCDSETRRLLGSLIVTGIEQAARARRNQGGERKPFYFCIDEFQDFCANDGGAQTLAQILSECRKFGLHLTLAHQTLAQVNERMQGALGNIQLKIVFGVSREDAEIVARHLFQVDGERIKHRVRDELQQDRSHPVFYSLQEEWEGFVQELQNLPPRTAFVKRTQRKAHRGVSRIRTIRVRYGGHTSQALSDHQRGLATAIGQARSVVEQAVRDRLVKIENSDQQPALLREKVDALSVV